MNFGPDRNIYKSLPPVNLESPFIHSQGKIVKIKKDVNDSADPEPKLENYLKPITNFDYQLKLRSELSNDDDDSDDCKMKNISKHNFQNLYSTFRKYAYTERLYK